MIGIFDSGVGGLVSYRELRRLLPKEDILYLADRRNAPYGTKSKDELIMLVKRDISRLTLLGAEKILIACCTASTVYGELSECEKDISIPIISPTAKHLATLAQESAHPYRIAVIATEHTKDSKAFSDSISGYTKNAKITEIGAQELVSFAESGEKDGKISTRTHLYLDSLCKRVRLFSPDALVLGCTHFSYFEESLRERLSGVLTVSPARLGAKEMYDFYTKNYDSFTKGRQRSLYTE